MLFMTDLDRFTQRIKNLCASNNEQPSIESTRAVVAEINRFLFTTYDDIGTVNTLGNNLQYFSEYHRFWNENYKTVLNLEINDDVCKSVATALHDVYMKTKGRAYTTVYNTNNLSKEDVCLIRMLTANQDFRGSRDFDKLSKLFIKDPSIFNVKKINEDPSNFIKCINMTNLSQNDKRSSYAKKICQFLIDKNATPYEIIDRYNRNVTSLRQALITCNGAGYGKKKADMFIRDMIVLGIWDNVSGFDDIDVASDINTIKVSLRTGILSSAVPLVSSFLDVFGLQYEYVDKMNVQAWRRVWNFWNNDFPGESISSPCILDYFIYNVIGKQFCKDKLCTYRCENGHEFKRNGANIKTCPICRSNGISASQVKIDKKVLPCTDEDGYIAICKSDFYKLNIASPNIKECPLKAICDITNKRQLEPPKAISIMGQTGWTKAYTNQESGGGGLMS